MGVTEYDWVRWSDTTSKGSCWCWLFKNPQRNFEGVLRTNAASLEQCFSLLQSQFLRLALFSQSSIKVPEMWVARRLSPAPLHICLWLQIYRLYLSISLCLSACLFILLDLSLLISTSLLVRQNYTTAEIDCTSVINLFHCLLSHWKAAPVFYHLMEL